MCIPAPTDAAAFTHLTWGKKKKGYGNHCRVSVHKPHVGPIKRLLIPFIRICKINDYSQEGGGIRILLRRSLISPLPGRAGLCDCKIPGPATRGGSGRRGEGDGVVRRGKQKQYGDFRKKFSNRMPNCFNPVSTKTREAPTKLPSVRTVTISFFYLNDLELRKFRGPPGAQHRLFALALKLAQRDYYTDELGDMPNFSAGCCVRATLIRPKPRCWCHMLLNNPVKYSSPCGPTGNLFTFDVYPRKKGMGALYRVADGAGYTPQSE